jgi:iron complex transport system substrate-binding protein
LAALFAALFSVSALGQQRIASLNLCTDLLLLELVPRSRIVSLTYWATDPDISYLAERAGGLPRNRGLVEEIVPMQPDLILASAFSDARPLNLLRKLGYRVEVVDVPLNLAGMRRHILSFGELVGEPAAALALADDIDRRLAGLTALVAAGEGLRADRPLAAVYGPQGVSPGEGTLMHDLLMLAGYRNLAAEAGVVGYGTLSLERLVMSKPSLLVIDDYSDNSHSVSHGALRHPVLTGMLPPDRLLRLPPALTACVGPPAVQVMEMLVQRRQSLLRAGQP